MKAAPARLITIALGVWLFISAFIWPHTPEQFANAWIAGLAIVACSAISMRMELMRYACAFIAMWLFFSNWILPTELEATAWNNIIVSISVFVASLAASEPSPRTVATPG